MGNVDVLEFCQMYGVSDRDTTTLNRMYKNTVMGVEEWYQKVTDEGFDIPIKYSGKVHSSKVQEVLGNIKSKNNQKSI